jgi:LytS/YehU family sensor histidine kinase
LQIEEARFADRLRTDIQVAHDVAEDPIPSLILQPLVENALKHGLAPKLGPCHLWISAKALGDQICLTVEDDGLGFHSGPGPPRTGDPLSPSGASRHKPDERVGLTNVTQRLATFYQERAHISLERRDPSGTRVTVLLPRQSTINGHDNPHR